MAFTAAKINAILSNYYCHNQEFEGEKIGLASALTPPDQLSITKGAEEVHLLSEHLAKEINRLLTK